ncbi:histidine phosphatase family protein [Nocardia farcinica]|uniref:Alpha-ribazole phosphatase n=1 Tax=Nocardia farcinica TaxID=37329 RepID=A0A0H5P048_NOCFR|nr:MULTISPECIES: histidine phosphatase family protein [Nocardia]AXK87047.1 histidine phosphatase family protein [Nocardia farcinica]MBA4859763.1 histidine phosphatase family protein [Nocardia farcinica]MBC9815627.1 histidine phosphatase family protein [Nocardia farcinica]MBF6069954.1 histidine phosphatase family protein [Nocardia farcinica]MBF6142821.1 histidine phosphatase family protein [Nocardia farcinica]
MTGAGSAGRLILVRHGETEGNVAKLLDTRVPGLPLTERGAAQAKTFGSTLLTPPRVLFTSEALRARQTASFIEAATGVAASVLEGVHEVQAGDLEGLNDEEAHRTFQRIYRAWHEGDLKVAVPGGESGADVLDRFLPVIEDLRQRFLDPEANTGDVLLVNHGAAMRLVARTLTGVGPPFTTNNHLDNTETIELVPRLDGGWECVRWGRFVPPFGYEVSPTADDPMG